MKEFLKFIGVVTLFCVGAYLLLCLGGYLLFLGLLIYSTYFW